MKPTRERYFTYNDISVVPAVISEIEHRCDVNPYTEDKYLPIFTAPMSTVVDEENFKLYEQNKIKSILPRNITLSTRIEYSLNDKWAAFSLKEFERYFCDISETYEYSKHIKVLIDVANGHMKKLYDLVKYSKNIFKNRIEIMVGNIANPETYIHAFHCGVDYVRVGIGSGFGCITSSNTAIHMPMGSLISGIVEIKNSLLKNNSNLKEEDLPKIIADGGIRNYNDIIKALALGADYVMIGSVLASTLESASETRIHLFENEKETIQTVDYNDIVYNNDTKKFNYRGLYDIGKITKRFYGMASSEGQKDLYGKKIKTCEGICKEIEVKTTIKGWAENFTDFLRSAMSYTNSLNLNKLKEAKTILISDKSYNTINK